MEFQLLDRTGRRRSPATLTSFHQGQTPRNKGLRCPSDSPAVSHESRQGVGHSGGPLGGKPYTNSAAVTENSRRLIWLYIGRASALAEPA